ncbi:MAG: hypothetical protein U9R29_05050 [Thermodesulfobacteriota bacterium]|nr:hypothetical protein [Thermodesulfobacteriota bacterium]
MPFGSIKLSSTIVVATIMLFVTTLIAYAEQDNDTSQFSKKVLALTQQCNDNMTNKELLQTIYQTNKLTEQIKKTQHLKKKWFIIRLKQTRNLCQYYLQLSSAKNDNLTAE